MGNRIGLNQVGAKRHKHFAHHGFARSNPASQSDFQQLSLIGRNPFHHRDTKSQRKATNELCRIL
jgi:hypothetical protein